MSFFLIVIRYDFGVPFPFFRFLGYLFWSSGLWILDFDRIGLDLDGRELTPLIIQRACISHAYRTTPAHLD